jgi:hypothetical protein
VQRELANGQSIPQHGSERRATVLDFLGVIGVAALIWAAVKHG